MKRKKILINLFIALFICIILTPISLANSISYQTDGLIDTITTENVTLIYQSDGLIDSIETGNVSIYMQSDGLLDLINTPSGQITFMSDGLIDTVNGNWRNILNDVQKALEIANNEIISYINSINIQVPGASNPSESSTVITESLNDIIEQLNTYNSYSTSGNNSSTVNNNNENTVNNNVNIMTNTNIDTSTGIDFSINSNGINVGTSDGAFSVDQNGININSSNDGSFSVDQNGININSSNNGSSINITNDTKSNNIFLYIIIGVVCYIVFLIIVFIIKSVQGEKANKKLMKIIIAVATLVLVIYVGFIIILNILEKPSSTQNNNLLNNNQNMLINNGATNNNVNNNNGSVSITTGNVSVNSNGVNVSTQIGNHSTNSKGLEFSISGDFKKDETIGEYVYGNIITCKLNGDELWSIPEFILYQEKSDGIIAGENFGTTKYNYLRSENCEILFDGNMNILALKTDDSTFVISPDDLQKVLYFDGSITSALSILNSEIPNYTFNINEECLKQIEKF